MTGLPSVIQPSNAVAGQFYDNYQDNSAYAVARFTIVGGTITFAKYSAFGTAASATGWTAAGVKGIGTGWTISYPVA
jgi:hypothetical protein